MKLVSINTGEARPLPGKARDTGIYKTARQGPIELRTLGLPGDDICDPRFHGGPDQAVYIYLSTDYAWWEAELDQPLEPGQFGENLTISELDGAGLAVGDRLTIGPVLLELTAHRAPCSTFAIKMGDPRWVKRFQKARRPGAYARVLTPGVLEAGMDVAYTPYDGDRIHLTEFVDIEGEREVDAGFLRRAFAVPLSARLRAELEERLGNR